jgi:flagellar operon protein
MSLDKAAGAMTGLNKNSPLGPQGLGGAQGLGNAAGSGASAADGAEFKRALEQIAAQMPTPTQATKPAGASQAAASVLGNQAVGATAKPQQAMLAGELKFSNHAIERMRSRGIGFQPEEMTKISNAIAKAEAKGAKDTLVLSGDNALIVSVKNKTVVTVMDRQAMKENVFTNIDSTVVI